MANRRKRLSLAASTPIHSPGGSEETDRDSPMVIAQDEVKAQKATKALHNPPNLFPIFPN